MFGRVRVEVPDNYVELGHDTCHLFRSTTNNGEGANALTVQTKVLGEGLRQEDWQTRLGKLTHGVSINLKITCGKTLVGTVKPTHVLLLFAQFHDLVPLLLCRVYTSGIVSCSVQQHDRTIRRIPDVSQHASK